MNPDNPANSSPSIGIVLAGGAGTRLGGVDKGLMNLNGQPLIEHVLACIEPQVDRVMIVANRHLDSYANYEHGVLSDSLPGFAGPLAGMLSGLRKAQEISSSARCLFVPVDAPRLPADLFERLSDGAGDDGLAMAATASGLQPVCNLVEARHLESLERDFDAGERSPAAWLKAHHARVVDFREDDDAIWSLNTPDDLQWAQQTLHNSGSAA